MENKPERIFKNHTPKSFIAIKRCKDDGGLTKQGPIIPGLRETK